MKKTSKQPCSDSRLSEAVVLHKGFFPDFITWKIKYIEMKNSPSLPPFPPPAVFYYLA